MSQNLSACSTIYSMGVNIDSQGTHNLTIKPDKDSTTELGTIDFELPSVSLSIPHSVKIDWNTYCVTTCPKFHWKYESYPLFGGLKWSETLTLNVPPPTLTFVCVAGSYLPSTTVIPNAFVTLTLTSIQCADNPITITDSEGTVLIDLSKKIEQELCIAIENIQPTFEAVKGSDAIYTLVKLGSVTDSFGKGKAKFDITLTFYLDLCLSQTGMGLYLKIDPEVTGSIDSYSYKGFNPFVKTINDGIDDWNRSEYVPTSWDIKPLPDDALTVTVPGFGPAKISGSITYLMCFLPFEP